MNRQEAISITESLLKGDGKSLPTITLVPGTKEYNALYDVIRLVDEKVDQRNLLTGNEWLELMSMLRAEFNFEDRHIAWNTEFADRLDELLDKVAQGLGYFSMPDMPEPEVKA